MTQGQRLNLKFTVGDVDRIARFAKSGMSPEQICNVLSGTPLESSIEEIAALVSEIRSRGYELPRVA